MRPEIESPDSSTSDDLTADSRSRPPGSRRAWWLAAAGYAVVTLVFASPLVNYSRLSDASYEGDARLLIWTLGWDAHALLSGAPLFSANMYYPAAQSLAFAEHHIGLAIFALPVYALTANPVLAYWTVWLMSFPLNALAMHALALRLTRDHRAAAIAGLVYGFCFFRMHHGHGHIQLLWTWALPLIPLAIERWLRRPTWGRTALLATLLAVQTLTSWYLAVFAALLACVTLVTLAAGQRMTARHVWLSVVGLAPAGALVGWFARPYRGLQTPGITEASGLGADAASYLLPPENTWMGQWVLRYTSFTPRWIWGEQTLYVGMVAVALAAVGVVAVARTGGPRSCRLTWALVITGVTALALSWGPASSGLAPFELFARLPGMSNFRAPARFALLVMLTVAALCAYGAAWILSRRRRWSGPVVAALGIAFLADSFLVGFPAGKPAPFPVPEIYRRLSALPAGAVLSLPTYWRGPEAFREADYLLYSTLDWRPIVNGAGRLEPDGYMDHILTLSRFPQPDAIERFRRLGIRYTVVHTGRNAALRDAVSAAAGRTDVDLVARIGDDYLYEIK
jgi:hypothetical protein